VEWQGFRVWTVEEFGLVQVEVGIVSLVHHVGTTMLICLITINERKVMVPQYWKDLGC
jgi:hypothetical protein